MTHAPAPSPADDPRLTAYALGELPESERAEVESLLAADPAAQRFVEETRAFAVSLAAEMRATPASGSMSDAQREAIRASVRATPRGRLLGLPAWTLPAVAAATLVTTAVVVVRRANDSRECMIARAATVDPGLREAAAAAPIRAPKPMPRRSRDGDAPVLFEEEVDEALAGPPPARPHGGAAEPATLVVRELAERNGALRDRLESASREGYAPVTDNSFRSVADSPLSTFGIDVDTASYANVRRILREGRLPPPGAVRIEEMLNSFRYDLPAPRDGSAFALHAEVAGCPWTPTHRLVRLGLRGREVDLTERPTSNLVFLVDVSGSMSSAEKLPLLVASMKLLVAKLDRRDTVSIVVYAGAAGLALAPTRGDRHDEIVAALDRLSAGGSTAGGAGIELAYRVASEHFVRGGVNRVILATDGDFNVGVSDDASLARLVEEKAKSNVFLTVLGFGRGNLQDAKMETLADRGNGNYAYVDSIDEGRRVLAEQASSTLLTIAKDVKLQVEFNPLRVSSYRLIGYENRALATEDFANDRKDSGDLGAGHTVTALYEIVPASLDTTTATEPLRYRTEGGVAGAAHSDELLAVKLRWKEPEGEKSALREFTVRDATTAFDAASADFQFAAAVAAFGMTLRGSAHRGSSSFELAAELARAGLVRGDPDGRRAEFLGLVETARAIRR